MAYFLSVMGVLFIVAGVFTLYGDRQVIQLDTRYDDICPLNSTTDCYVNVTVTQDMTAPVYVYYRLTDVYQNHRKYTSSRDEPQLEGGSGSKHLNKYCSPAAKFDGDTIYPCGLQASSVFNDTINLAVCAKGSQNCTVMEGENWKQEAWPSDVRKFQARALKPTETNTSYFSGEDPNSYQIVPPSDQRLLVWMRCSRAGSHLTKLDRVISNRDLKEGEHLNFRIESKWRNDLFGGEKGLVISTMSWNGGQAKFLGITFVVAGCLAIAVSMIALLWDKLSEREPGQLLYFKVMESRRRGSDVRWYASFRRHLNERRNRYPEAIGLRQLLESREDLSRVHTHTHSKDGSGSGGLGSVRGGDEVKRCVTGPVRVSSAMVY